MYEGIAELPGIRFRKRPDPDGDVGAIVFIRFETELQCDRFVTSMKAEGVPAARPGSASILPAVPFIEKKIPPRANWPSFLSERGKSIEYGARICPRSIDIVSRFAGPPMDPKYTRSDVDDIIATVRKVYPVVSRAV